MSFEAVSVRGGAAGSRRAWWFLLAILGVLYFLYFPGLLSSDSESSLAEGRAWHFSDWHPPILAIVWGVLDKIVAGPALMLACQLCFFVAGTYLLGRGIFAREGRLAAALATASLCLSPMLFLINGVIWKDIWATAALALSMGAALRDQRRHGWKWGVVAVLAGFVSILFRPNSVGATVAIFGLLFLRRLPLGQPGGLVSLLRALVLGTVLSLACMIGALGFNRLVSTPSHAEISIQFFDIAGTIANSSDPATIAREVEAKYPLIVAEKGKFAEQVMASYTPEKWGDLNREWGNARAPFAVPITDESRVQYSAAWKALMKADFPAYAKHRWRFFVDSLGLYYSPAAGRNGLSLDNDQDATSGFLRKVGAKVERSWMMSPGVWLLCCVVPALLLLTPLRRDETWAPTLWLGLSAVGLSATLLVLGPSPDYRYYQWVVLSGGMILLHAGYRWLAMTSKRNTHAH